MDLKVNILISTIDSGIKQLDKVIIKPRDNAKYIVSHLYSAERFETIPSFLKRDDIIVSQIEGKGVTKSRNNTIRIADGDVGLFADDDVTYQDSYLDTLHKVFQEDPELDVGFFKIKTPPGDPEYKNYPGEAAKIKNVPSVGTVDIEFRIDRIKKEGIRFDERSGAAQPLLIGSDDRLFIQDCIDAGLKVKFFPKFIVNHPFESTVKQIPKYI